MSIIHLIFLYILKTFLYILKTVTLKIYNRYISEYYQGFCHISTLTWSFNILQANILYMLTYNCENGYIYIASHSFKICLPPTITLEKSIHGHMEQQSLFHTLFFITDTFFYMHCHIPKTNLKKQDTSAQMHKFESILFWLVKLKLKIHSNILAIKLP